MTPNDLIRAINLAFGYTDDNNRDVVSDATFTLAETNEELLVQYARDYLTAYIVRNEEMIASNLKD